MALIVGAVGGIACIYSTAYTAKFHAEHGELKDRQRRFFFLQILFLSAMFGVVFSNNLLLLHFSREVTTVRSFLLIDYGGTDRSRRNAFLALTLNLLGGLAFSGAILYSYARLNTVELDTLVNGGMLGLLLPTALLAFAGLTKSA
jgi:ech hydrogenase subunit A